MGIGSLLTDWVEDRVEDWRDRLFDFLGKVAVFSAESTFKAIDPDLWKAIQTSTAEIANATHSASIRDIATGKQSGVSATSGDFGSIDWEGIPVGQIAIEKISWLAALVGAPLGLLPINTELASGGLFPLIREQGARAYRPARVDIHEAIKAAWRDARYGDMASEDAANQGWTAHRRHAIAESMKPLLDPDMVRQLILRGEDPDGKIEDELIKAGWTKERIEAMQKLYEIIPPLADMVRFADYSGFDPEVIERWRQYYDAPDWIKDPFALLGVTGEWANRYWFSHWRQPGRFELGELHRRFLIEDDDAKLAYKTQGYSEYWQDLLLRLVEEPLTRVDIRRMHAVGMLSDEALSKVYHAVGFYGENNDLMVEFTKRYNADSARSVTESKILKAYRQGDIGRDTALELLTEIGYTETDADFVLATEDDDQASTKRDLTVSNIKNLYLAGINDKTETTERLVNLGYPAESIADLYALWELETAASVRVPTRSELTHFLSIGIIDETTFRDRMAADGYQPEHIKWYLEELAADEVAAAQSAEEKARTAQEKVAAAEEKSTYEQEKVKLDVEISVRRTYIAEQQLAALQTTDEDLKAEIKENIAAARVDIADLQEQKARLKL